jgi:DNA helicase IV
MSLNQLDMLKPSVIGRLKGQNWMFHVDGEEVYVAGLTPTRLKIPLDDTYTQILSSNFGFKLKFKISGISHVIDCIRMQHAKVLKNLIAFHQKRRFQKEVAGFDQIVEKSWSKASEQVLPAEGYIRKADFDKAKNIFLAQTESAFNALNAMSDSYGIRLPQTKGLAKHKNILECSESFLASQNTKRLMREFKAYKSVFESAGLTLTDEQALAALSMEDANLLEAGAGSGKTVVIIARILYAVASGRYRPGEILCLAYNAGAAEEIRDRLSIAFQKAGLGGSEEVMVNTFHALGYRIVNTLGSSKKEVLDENNRQAQEIFSRTLDEVAQLEEYRQAFGAFARDFSEHHFLGRKCKDKKQLMEKVSCELQKAEQAFYMSPYNAHDRSPQADLLEGSNPWNISNSRASNLEGFHSLVRAISKKYRKELCAKDLIDFSGMTVEGSRIVANLPANGEPGNWHMDDLVSRKFILVDEFQDISYDRADLVRRIARLNADAVVFGVGDDWQSINRFSGSDLRLFTRFETFFGTTDRRHLTATFRSCRGIAESARLFVTKNPEQSKKRIERVYDERIEGSVVVMRYSQDEQVVSSIEHCIEQWVREHPGVPSVMIIDRNSLKKSKVINEKLLADLQACFSGRADISFKTAHSSKGLEADYVIITGLIEGVFPSKRVPDFWTDLYRPRQETGIEFPDERRLFYVALTRAKKCTMLLTPKIKPSRFASEIENIINRLIN